MFSTKLCVSLDLPTKEENLILVEKIKDFDVWLKVGLRSFVRDGKEFLQELKKINPNFKIFLDLKLYDIPNTMADTAEEIAKFGTVDMFNVHASSGLEAMRTVVDRIKDIPNKPLVLAVTALTSFDDDSFKDVYSRDIDSAIQSFTKNVKQSGMDGVVCSAFESLKIKDITTDSFITLCPGIRPFGENANDQKRVADISFAKKNKANFIVIGRPIYKNSNPREIIERILKNL